MFHLRNCFHISVKLYRQHVIHKTVNHHLPVGLYSTSAFSRLTGFESQFAHTVLEGNPKCRVLRGEQNENNDVESVEIDWDQNWRDQTTSGIVKSLETVGNYCKQSGTPISDERFDNFVDACTERCFDFSDDQLIQSLQILTRYPVTGDLKVRNFVELWNAFDDVCVKRIVEWDNDKILYVCDHWHALRLGRLNQFLFQGCRKAGSKVRRLPPHQLVQLMFYLSIKRMPFLDMFAIETNLIKSLDDFSLDEIGVLCMGFFKTQTRIKDTKLIEKIYQRTIPEIHTVESITLTNIIKALRLSCTNAHAVLVRNMLNAANDQLPRLSTLTCLHVGLLGTHLHICHQSCIDQILHRFSNDIESIRLKDFERISYVMGFFDFRSESNIESRLCQQFLTELRNRVDEIVQHPKCFALCLHYLTMKGYHDEEMISVALSKQFLQFAYGNQVNYDHELFGLDSYVKINLKGTYTGNELTEKNRSYMGRMMVDYIPDRSKPFKISYAENILLEVKETTDELCKHSYLKHALPHFNKPDIIIAYDKQLDTGIDIAHNLPPHYTGKIIDRSMLVEGLNIDMTNVEIVNIIVGGWGNYNRDTSDLNGHTKQKIGQSKILGLRPVVVPWFDWKRLHEDERKLYIKGKLNEALQDK